MESLYLIDEKAI